MILKKTVVRIAFFTAAAFLAISGLAVQNQEESPAKTKPSIRLLSDGFPGGQDTPEGAAADLARAFIQRDPDLFLKTCVRRYGPAEYANFQEGVIRSIKDEASRQTPSPGGPKSIGKLFAARHLSKDGPASYGYALFQFQDVMFVDVGVILQNGEKHLNRTLVIKDKDGEWYVHPVPDVSPLLSMGLNQESGSTRDFSEVYEIVK